ncbi:MAG: CoB--CoM heterodisulfide reductase iron-sulfur subunit B family protein [Candidatus Magnetomorum sp.]|nr:CoB--CoM heterodisulfide reductase iron-sulfur subunit B family protein [Candidatus Magnetomorum sp.]
MQLKYCYFPGCKISGQLPEYGDATLTIMNALNVKLVDMPFNCCGYPIRHQSMEASIFSAARNIALAESVHLDIMTPCKCCFGNLKHSQHLLETDTMLFKSINDRLKEEDLSYSGKLEIKHLLTVLYQDVGLEKIEKQITHPLPHSQKVAASYGCHALRPASVTNFDHPFDPTLFEKLVETTGAQTVFWPKRSECCGHPISEKNQLLSKALLKAKVMDAVQANANMICTACTYCQIQYDSMGKDMTDIPVITFSQLLAGAMGKV